MMSQMTAAVKRCRGDPLGWVESKSEEGKMFTAVRKRITYANVAMTLALVFAMTGGAYAAKKYLITSTKQISPSVLKALAGKPGPAGPAGAPGANGKDGVNGKDGALGLEGKEGPQGKEGKEGPQGKEGKQGIQGLEGKEGSPWTVGGTLPSGKTETGAYAAPEDEVKEEVYHFTYAAVTFSIPLATAPTALKPGDGEYASKCTGTAEKPTAAAGYLCIYPGKFGGIVEAIISPATGTPGATSVTGYVVQAHNAIIEAVWGTYAVTAN